MTNKTLSKELHEMANVQKKHENSLLEMQNVVGVSLGNRVKGEVESDEPVITLLVNHKMDSGLLQEEHHIPKKLDNFHTDVVEVGDIFAGGAEPSEADSDEGDQGDGVLAGAQAVAYSPSLTRRIRPAQGGYSVGHHKITAGTLGTCCYDWNKLPGMPQKYYILSNNHVLANTNNAKAGDPILQPGPYDGGRIPKDIIARLSRFVPIKFIVGDKKPCNYVDAAIAEGNLADLNREIYWIGSVKRLYIAPKVGDIVQKTGRTTGFTTGRVTSVNATVNVNYGAGRIARFCNQIITSPMSAGGDSGSLVTNLDEGGVGLLFAGSSRSTIINNIYFVQKLLNVRITEK